MANQPRLNVGAGERARAARSSTWIAAYPIVALTILALDLTVIYVLLVYGGARSAARAARARAVSASGG